MPNPARIAEYAREPLGLRRPSNFNTALSATGETPRPSVKTQPRAIVTGDHGQQRRGQIWAAMAHRAVTPYIPTPGAAPKYGRVIECSWPINDGHPWKFCSADSLPGKSYCHLHHKEAYVRVRDRREDVVHVGDLA
jgi:hypothetical protein